MEKISEEIFDEKIALPGNVIIDFSSPGCAPCKKVPPLLSEIIAENPEKKISAFEVDVTENPGIATRFFVLGVPTIIIFNSGSEVARFNSVPAKGKIVSALK
ncbi:MAG: thioredoxin family protein [Candidatus Aminicenantes bacterium]|nr:thioredoxin family protein [Candidatus Aminicenantes bacterium]